MCRPFWASKWVEIQVFGCFVKRFPVDSHQCCFICSLKLLYEMCAIGASKTKFLGQFGQNVNDFLSVLLHISSTLDVLGIWASEAIFCATLGPKISKCSSIWSFAHTFSIGFASVLVYMSMWANFRGVSHFGLRDPVSGSFWTLK